MKIRILLSVLTMCLCNQIILSQERAAALSSTWWKIDKIPVCWEKTRIDYSLEKAWVKEAITESWQKHSKLEFTCWCDCTDQSEGIRITIDDSNPQTSALGNKINGIPGGMVLNFDLQNWGCENFRGPVPCSFPYRTFSKKKYIQTFSTHEFGHALGFAHEQNRGGCDFPNCDGREQGTDGDWWLSVCDTFSVMNYCNPKYGNNGELSEQDILALNQLYGNGIRPEITAQNTENNNQNNQSNMAREKLFLIYTVTSDYANAFDDDIVVPVKDQNSNSIQQTSEITYRCKVYLQGNQEKLDEVEYVVYHLHPSFREKIVFINSREDNFGLDLHAWGEFTLKADVILKDKTLMPLSQFLDYNPNN